MALRMANNIKLRSIDLPRKDCRDFDVDNVAVLAQASDLTPGGTTGPLLDGEFVKLTSEGKLVRALDDSGQVAYCSKPAYMVIAGAGRTDTLVTKKATVYFGTPGLEFDTKLFKSSDNPAVGDALTVGSVSFDGNSTYKAALKAKGSGPTVAVVVADTSLTGTDYIRVRLV